MGSDDPMLTTKGPNSGELQIDPDEGFGPHISDKFLALYGEDSVFVTGTVDCLSHRLVAVLRASGELSDDHVAIQYGSSEMRESIETLLEALHVRGLDNSSVLLMQSAVGQDDPNCFLEEAASTLGTHLVAKWLRHLEAEDYVAAKASLATH